MKCPRFAGHGEIFISRNVPVSHDGATVTDVVTTIVRRHSDQTAAADRLPKILDKLDHLKFEENSHQICGDFALKRRFSENDSFRPVC